MAHLMLVNPRRKRRRAVKRNPKRRKMTAAQAKYFGPRRRKRKSATRSRRRRASTAVARVVRRTRRAGRRFARSRSGRLNLGAITSGRVIRDTVLPAAVGALGAIALDVAYAYLPLPANLKGGQFAAPVKAAAVLGIGALASQFLPGQRRTIDSAVAASLTIMAYNWARAQVGSMFPALQMSEYVDGLGYTGAAQFLPDYSAPGNQVSEYISGVDNTGAAWGDSVYGDQIF